MLLRTIIKFSYIVGNNVKKRTATCSCASRLTSHRRGYKGHFVSFTVNYEQSIQERSTDLSQGPFHGEFTQAGKCFFLKVCVAFLFVDNNQLKTCWERLFDTYHPTPLLEASHRTKGRVGVQPPIKKCVCMFFFFA